MIMDVAHGAVVDFSTILAFQEQITNILGPKFKRHFMCVSETGLGFFHNVLEGVQYVR